ncbi:MAG: SGNH/GDSL hydrolase family protein [Fibrobacteraceae bacterium]
MNSTILKAFYYSLIVSFLVSFNACGSSSNSASEDSSSSSSGQEASAASNSSDQSSSDIQPASSNAELSWQDISILDPSVRITGRVDYSVENQASVAWSGSAFTIAFTGTEVKIKLSAPGSVFNVYIDSDTTVLDLSQSNEEEHLLADNLSFGPHVVTVYKRTEAQYGSAIFKGFSILGTPSASILPALPTKRIEFIGNSITCGYGNLDSIKEHTFDILTEDHSFTYAAMAAKNLGAEEHTVCFSGRGMYRNNTGDTDGTLPELFLLQEPYGSDWNFQTWMPDLVSINLGTNDFYLGIPDSAAFVNASVTFVKKIRTFYPSASIVRWPDIFNKKSRFVNWKNRVMRHSSRSHA